MIKFLTVNPETFFNSINRTKKHKEFLTINPVNEYKKTKTFLNKKNNSGYAITPNNEIISLFNNSGIKGLGRGALNDAIKNGGDNLNCFDGFLAEFYKSEGFIETHRIKFDKLYAPKNWNYKKYGQPDLVFLTLK